MDADIECNLEITIIDKSVNYTGMLFNQIPSAVLLKAFDVTFGKTLKIK